MESKPYLIFSLHGLQYGIDAQLVQEIFLLPELTSIAAAPDDIVGILNLRSQILPVMDLDLRSGHQPQEYRLSDSVIALQWEELRIGIVVNSVHEVKNINSEVIEAETSYGREREINSRFIAGVAKVDADIIMLLNHDKLLRDADAVEALLSEAINDDEIDESTNDNSSDRNSKELVKFRTISSFYDLCCPNTTPEQKGIFRDRAENLRQSTENAVTGLIPLAVVELNGEYFGLDLQLVREFTNIRNVTPIPCCPAHIVGNINLRGEIVTLVDIRSALNMPLATASNTSQAIVIHVDDTVAGVTVDQVFDVMYLSSTDITPVPAALHSGSDEYLQGTAAYSEKMLSILDLPKIITNGGLAVNEEA